ncbi:hypothetical protein HDU96_010197 [Phlyctochytrium bullatum]|nr:hypothetical protein HDU96_010197 [Phlyctochytrium bullatum]
MNRLPDTRRKQIVQPQNVKPARYWPGRAPLLENEVDRRSDDSDGENDDQAKPINALSTVGPSDNAVVVIETSRLKSLLNRSSSGRNVEGGVDAGDNSTGGPGEDNEEEMLKRRQRLKEIAMKRQSLNERDDEELGQEELGVGDDEDETSEYTTDSEDEQVTRAPLFKPVFVPKLEPAICADFNDS